MAIVFNRTGLRLRVAEEHLHWNYSNPGIALGEAELTEIQRWCEQHQCGVRTSFDTFKFRNKKDMMAFLLRWT
jgi:hypothetical protein